jgi:hypothetical protein
MDETLTVGKKSKEEMEEEIVTKKAVTNKELRYSNIDENWGATLIIIPVGSKINYIGDLPKSGKGHIRLIDENGEQHVLYLDRKDIEDVEG